MDLYSIQKKCIMNSYFLWSSSSTHSLGSVVPLAMFIPYLLSGFTPLVFGNLCFTPVVFDISGFTHVVFDISGFTHVVFDISGFTQVVFDISGFTYVVFDISGFRHVVFGIIIIYYYICCIWHLRVQAHLLVGDCVRGHGLRCHLPLQVSAENKNLENPMRHHHHHHHLLPEQQHHRLHERHRGDDGGHNDRPSLRGLLPLCGGL